MPGTLPEVSNTLGGMKIQLIKVEKLLKTRDDIFSDYNEASFEKCFSKYFEIVKKNNIQDSMRVIYLMKVI